jgi:non-specific serine/threonine protein kinase
MERKMNQTIIFTPEGYRVDGGKLTTEQLYNAAFGDSTPDEAAAAYLARVARAFADTAARSPDIAVTRAAPPADTQVLLELLRALPYCLGMEYVSLAWLQSLWNKIAGVFNAELAAFSGTPEEYLKSKNTSLNVAGRVFFHLVETKEETYPFAFLATYSTKSKTGAAHLPLKRALEEFGGDQSGLLHLLATVSKAADQSDFITDLVESGELFHPLKFQPQEAYTFLREVPLYEECGVICRIPDFWKRKGRSRLTLKLGSKEPSVLGMQSLVAFSPSAFLGDVELTREELEKLLGEYSGLALLKGKWVEVDRDKLTELLGALDEYGKHGDLSLAESLKMLSGVGLAADNDDALGIETTSGEWLNGIMEKMREPAKIKAVKPPKTFRAILRHYQQAGLNWLNFTRDLGFGALLADDMGLGKTVQILALLDRLRAGKVKSLLIVPASLLVNWQKEAAKFAPKLKLAVVYGTTRDISLDSADLFVTTYGMAARLEELAHINWDLLILDEAQAIKNAGTKSTKAVKKIPAKTRIAMTGTPIENRLADLWSIFDFLNKGMLGTAKEFSAFSSKLKDHPEGYAKLRGAVSPFILRRLKTDKSVIPDLPDKVEIREFTTLTKKQAALYNALVKEIERAFSAESDVSAIERKGRILAAIMKFKQICNHPDQYIGQGKFDAKHSGKFETLAEICETIRDKHESVLVFTQFREMCDPLSKYLAAIFDRSGLVIHGGVTAKKRGEIVEKFNSEYIPFMVLSLKAGGVGLNLTSANHVVHFDRWWNPAVENQATDRTFRIGQTKDVMVHKFVTSGTIEEKIDEIISGKQQLAAYVIGASAGENWVTEMSNAELLNLFRLEV